MSKSRPANGMGCSQEDLRWHRYRLEWTQGNRTYLLNLLNKACIAVDVPSREGPLIGQFRPFQNDDLNQALRRANFVVPSSLSDEELLAGWFALFSDRGNVFDWQLHLTRECDLACVYCFQEAKPETRHQQCIGWRQMLQPLTAAIASASPQLVRVTFFGGEPLLQLDAMADICRSISDTCAGTSTATRFDIVTNGYLMNEAACQLLNRYQMGRIQITLDGPKHIHDARRPLRRTGEGTFTRTLANIKTACCEYGLRIRLRTNIDEHNCRHYPELLRELASLGLRESVDLALVPTKRTSPPLCHCEEYCFTDKEASNALRECIDSASEMGFSLISSGIELGPCMAVSKGAIVVCPDGSVYKCPGFVGDDRCCLGNIANGAIQALQDDVIPSPWRECIKCKYVPICGGGCRYEAIRKEKHGGGKPCRRNLFDKLLVPIYSARYSGG